MVGGREIIFDRFSSVPRFVSLLFHVNEHMDAQGLTNDQGGDPDLVGCLGRWCCGCFFIIPNLGELNCYEIYGQTTTNIGYNFGALPSSHRFASSCNVAFVCICVFTACIFLHGSLGGDICVVSEIGLEPSILCSKARKAYEQFWRDHSDLAIAGLCPIYGIEWVLNGEMMGF